MPVEFRTVSLKLPVFLVEALIGYAENHSRTLEDELLKRIVEYRDYQPLSANQARKAKARFISKRNQFQISVFIKQHQTRSER